MRPLQTGISVETQYKLYFMITLCILVRYNSVLHMQDDLQRNVKTFYWKNIEKRLNKHTSTSKTLTFMSFSHFFLILKNIL